MQVATGTVVAGKLVVEGLDLPDGESVVVLTREVEDEVHLSPEAWAPNRPSLTIGHVSTFSMAIGQRKANECGITRAQAVLDCTGKVIG